MRTDFKCMYLIDERLYNKKILSDESNQSSSKSYYNITTPVNRITQPVPQIESSVMKNYEVRNRIGESPEKCLKNNQVFSKTDDISDLQSTVAGNQTTPLNSSMMDTNSVKSENGDCDACMTEKNADEQKNYNMEGFNNLKKVKSKINKQKKIKKKK